jgi:glutaredoxin
MDTVRLHRLVVLTVALLACLSIFAAAEDAALPLILVFYEEGCPSCVQMEELIAELASGLPESAIRRYEIRAPGTLDLLSQLESAYEVNATSVPVVFVGDEAVVGSGRAEEIQVRAAIGDCINRGCSSPLERIEPSSFPWKDVVWLAVSVAVLLVLAIVQMP